MPLNSFRFIIFLAGVGVTLRLVEHRVPVARRFALLAASILFYVATGLRSLPVLAGSILINWLMARVITASREPLRFRWLTIGIVLNVTILAFFKYSQFLLHVFAGPSSVPSVPIDAIPLGVSFFTLQQIMYLVDCAEDLVPAHSLCDHALFVSFFPYITAGPITRARAMIPQFRGPKGPREDGEDFAKGLAVFAIGVFKKSVVADALGTLVDTGYADILHLGHVGAWVCSLSYSLQLYFDFSGYSDMAIGSARMLGIELPPNFEAPYRARSISEFWQRWHITLSRFITTYLFTPLLRNMGRPSAATAAAATLVSMAIAGLWHGPSWNFVIFGAIHGLALSGLQLWKKWKAPRLPRLCAWGVTMAVVNVGFIFFRCPSFSDAAHVCYALLPWSSLPAATLAAQVRGAGLATYLPIWILAPLIVASERPSGSVIATFAPTRRAAVLTVMLLAVAALFMNSNIGKGFVYAAF